MGQGRLAPVLGLAVILPWLGCIHRAPTPPLAPVAVTPPSGARPHLLGAWELPSRSGTKQMIFEPDGRLTFRGGLDYYNGGRWSLNESRKELTLTLSNTPDEKLDIFHMYIGQGVKSFDRKEKEVTFAFDEETWSLNIAGWTYSKPEQAPVAPQAEPVFK